MHVSSSVRWSAELRLSTWVGWRTMMIDIVGNISRLGVSDACNARLDLFGGWILRGWMWTVDEEVCGFIYTCIVVLVSIVV